MTTTVRLGFAVGSGDPVEIPIRNMCIAGQTQEAGKTTALEGLVARSGLRAVTFITKRGEGSFAGARRLGPYFREQADWQFVAAILEASRGERLKFERPWIIRASKGARTLADVHNNVKKALLDPKIRGMSQDVYLTLDAYLEIVVPAIARVRWASGLDLRGGVNAMDLTALPAELQHLVIKSALDWVLEHANDTIVVIPEAWKFIPQGRGTPVKRAADALIRQGSGLRDYVWLDSQDIGGVEKEILRHCPVWLLGVQREANEIKRTLSNIPAGVAKPSAADIATLELGQFFACWGKHAVKTYAQPAWLGDDVARDVARNPSMVRGRQQPETLIPYTPDPAEDEETTMYDERLAQLQRENEELHAANKDLRRHLATLQAALEARGFTRIDPPQQLPRTEPIADDDVLRDIAADRAKDPALAERVIGPPSPAEVRANAKRTAGRVIPGEYAEFRGRVPDAATDLLYQDIRARLLEDPEVLTVLAAHPAIEVQLTRRVEPIDGSTFRGRVARLMAAGFFATPRTTNAVRQELARTGTDPGSGGTLIGILKNFKRDGYLVAASADSNGFLLATDVSITVRELSVA